MGARAGLELLLLQPARTGGPARIRTVAGDGFAVDVVEHQTGHSDRAAAGRVDQKQLFLDADAAHHQCAARNDMCAPTTTGPTRPPGSTHASPGWTTWLDTTARAAKTRADPTRRAPRQRADPVGAPRARCPSPARRRQRVHLRDAAGSSNARVRAREEFRRPGPPRRRGSDASSLEVDHYRDCGGVQ